MLDNNTALWEYMNLINNDGGLKEIIIKQLDNSLNQNNQNCGKTVQLKRKTQWEKKYIDNKIPPKIQKITTRLKIPPKVITFHTIFYQSFDLFQIELLRKLINMQLISILIRKKKYKIVPNSSPFLTNLLNPNQNNFKIFFVHCQNIKHIKSNLLLYRIFFFPFSFIFRKLQKAPHNTMSQPKFIYFQLKQEQSLNITFGKKIYYLDNFNSITLRNGLIYNLLDDSMYKQRYKKEIKCNCTQSKCQARYCQCFSKGKKCSEQCGCINCNNNQVNSNSIKVEFKGCKCEKSNCIKNYCQCRKQENFCSEKCKCTGCQNTQKHHKDQKSHFSTTDDY